MQSPADQADGQFARFEHQTHPLVRRQAGQQLHLVAVDRVEWLDGRISLYSRRPPAVQIVTNLHWAQPQLAVAYFFGSTKYIIRLLPASVTQTPPWPSGAAEAGRPKEVGEVP